MGTVATVEVATWVAGAVVATTSPPPPPQAAARRVNGTRAAIQRVWLIMVGRGPPRPCGALRTRLGPSPRSRPTNLHAGRRTHRPAPRGRRECPARPGGRGRTRGHDRRAPPWRGGGRSSPTCAPGRGSRGRGPAEPPWRGPPTK